jgi:predicted nicotinamide N-methyase
MAALPDDAAIERLLDEHATFGSAPLCPEISVFVAKSVMTLWEAAERIVGDSLDHCPFWSIPWPGGIAAARWLLDEPERVRGKTVLDVGSGGGITALAAARAGAARVVALDKDPWALRVTALAAKRQGLGVEPWLGELGPSGPPGRFDVVLGGDLWYERFGVPVLDERLDALAREGSLVVVADAGRRFFKTDGLEHVRTVDAPASSEIDDAPARRTTLWIWRGR